MIAAFARRPLNPRAFVPAAAVSAPQRSHVAAVGEEEDLLRSVDGCRNLSSLPTLLSLHSDLRSLNRTREPSVAIQLMRAYAACGAPRLAREVFDETTDKNVVFYNVLIRGYVNNRLFSDAILVFSQLVSSHEVRPDHYTFPCALKACSGLKELALGHQIHAYVSKVGLDSNLFVGNGLIALYSKCELCYSALKLFETMPHRDVVSWNSLIAGYAQCGLFANALGVCKKMVETKRPRPDAGTMASVLPATSSATSEDIRMLRQMFDEMPSRGLVAWNAMIAVYANNSLAKEAVDVYLSMEAEGVFPDEVTFASVLPACGEISALALGSRIHRLVERKNMFPNMVLENALMDMYAKCGCLVEAREIFDSMPVKDVVSWTAIITAYGMHGKGGIAIDLFERMRGSGLNPDHIAFVSILSACSYAGLLNEGKGYFRIMTEEYRLVPRLEHFACMVDILGRAGRIKEAYDFVVEMPIQPNERVWGALLGACRVHSDMTIGLQAADRLFDLVPQQSGYYVLLSNIYARAGRWEDVESVRTVMASRGVRKQPGRSVVELGNKVHTFYIGDKSHPCYLDICKKLQALTVRMKELGYAAETHATLHDVDDEEKESHLSVHSEKLAIAFVLINTAPGTPVRVTMNLRMCGDCHRTAKLISGITAREFVIKDTNRFHHFVLGECSCGDYW